MFSKFYLFLFLQKYLHNQKKNNKDVVIPSTPFCISNAEKVSSLSVETPSKVGISNDKWCKKIAYSKYTYFIK